MVFSALSSVIREKSLVAKELRFQLQKDKKPLEKIVGNGSKVKVMYKPYEWNFKGKKGIGLDLQAVQVMDLVEYTPREEFDVETGNTSGSGVDNIKEF